MKTFEIHTAQQGTRTFTGEVLGAATSASDFHTHPGPHVPPGRDEQGRKNKCAACRWFEVTIYDDTTNDEFVLHTVGKTKVPGEIEFARIVSTKSARELVDLAVVRANPPYLPAPTSRALAQAADLDDDIRDAYDNRAVL